MGADVVIGAPAHRPSWRQLGVRAGLVAAATVSSTACSADGSPTAVGQGAATGPATTAAVATSATALPVRQPPDTSTFDVDGRSVHFECRGRGTIPVVLVAGGIDPGTKWEPLLNVLGEDVLACVFDRPGVGTSDPSPVPVTPTSIGATLEAVLSQADLGPRAIVVGHSIGGLDLVVFGSQLGPRLAGAVLVDATVPFELTPSDVQLLTGLGYDPSATMEQALSPGPWPAVPLEVLTHDPSKVIADGQFTPDEQSEWEVGQEQWRKLTSDASLIVVPNSGHDISIDEPAAVAAAVKRVLTRVR